MTALLKIQDVKVHFGGVRALDGVSFALEPGVLYGLVGPNGSGKSTLLGALSRMTNITSGVLSFRERDYQNDSAPQVARMGIGRTFQTVRLLPSLNVIENVMLGADARCFGQKIVPAWLAPWRTRRCEAASRDSAQHAIDRMRLNGMEDRFPTMLPYGTQRRVEIARALAAEPELLLLDEPTAGMSRSERDEIGVVLQDLRAQGLTQVLVEHDVQMITDVCQHVFVMNFGRIIADGDPHTVVQLPAVQEAYLGKRAQHAAS